MAKAVGSNQICEVQPEWFADDEKREMFYRKLKLLQEINTTQHSKNIKNLPETFLVETLENVSVFFYN